MIFQWNASRHAHVLHVNGVRLLLFNFIQRKKGKVTSDSLSYGASYQMACSRNCKFVGQTIVHPHRSVPSAEETWKVGGQCSRRRPFFFNFVGETGRTPGAPSSSENLFCCQLSSL